MLLSMQRSGCRFRSWCTTADQRNPHMLCCCHKFHPRCGCSVADSVHSCCFQCPCIWRLWSHCKPLCYNCCCFCQALSQQSLVHRQNVLLQWWLCFHSLPSKQLCSWCAACAPTRLLAERHILRETQRDLQAVEAESMEMRACWSIPRRKTPGKHATKTAACLWISFLLVAIQQQLSGSFWQLSVLSSWPPAATFHVHKSNVTDWTEH